MSVATWGPVRLTNIYLHEEKHFISHKQREGRRGDRYNTAHQELDADISEPKVPS